MRHYLWGIVILLFTMGLILPQSGVAKSYDIPVIRVEVSIQPDGTVHITEHRTYEFDGSFSWADYRLPLQGYTTIRDIRVAGADSSFINRNSEEPGTFRVQRGDNQIRVQWFYHAEDERRTFSISYTLEGALVVGPEWTEFFWNYISSDREQETDSLDIRMQLPQSVGTDSIYSWARGPQSKISINNHAAGYQAVATRLDDNESIKIRAVFPRKIFDQQAVSVTNQDYTLAGTREDEEQYQKELATRQERDARYVGYGRQLAVIISLLSIGVFLFFYRKYGKRHTAATVSATETIMIPGRLKPATAGWLLQGRSVSSLHLMATLLDLARRNHFVIHEQEPKEGWFGNEEKQFRIERGESDTTDELTEWEASLKDFIEKQIAEDNNRIDELFSNSSYSASKWFSSWKTQLNDYCQAKNWYDTESYKGVYANTGLQILLLIGAIIATVWAGIIGVIPIIITLGFAAGSVGIIRRTPEGEATYKRWKAYKEGLKNAKEHSIGNDLLDKHAIYAVAFGLSKEDIQSVLSQHGDPSSAFVWFVIHQQTTTSTTDFAGAFSTLSATGTASFPGSASAGATGAGGASAGAAGGGAAGGAG